MVVVLPGGLSRQGSRTRGVAVAGAAAGALARRTGLIGSRRTSRAEDRRVGLGLGSGCIRRILAR